MAYGDLAVLLPHESQYATPEQATAAARAEAEKRASYLSQMDMFYTQLEESREQFEKNYAFREKEFEWQSGFEERRFEHSAEMDERRLLLEEEMADIDAEIARQDLKLREAQTETEKGRLEIAKSELELEKERLRETLGLERERLESDTEMRSRELALGRDQLGLEAQRALFEQKATIAQLGMEDEGENRASAYDETRGSMVFGRTYNRRKTGSQLAATISIPNTSGRSDVNLSGRYSFV